MQKKLANCAKQNFHLDFKLNLTILNEIIYATATVISRLIKTHKQNSFKQPKWKLRIQN